MKIRLFSGRRKLKPIDNINIFWYHINCSWISVNVSEDLVRLGYVTLKRTKDFKNIFKKDIITNIYKPTKGFKTKIFGKLFINNHQYEYNIIYKKEIYKLTVFFDDIEDNYNPDDLIIIKLRGINNIKSINWMISECDLLSLSDIKMEYFKMYR